MHGVIALTAASDGVVVLGGVAAIVRATFRIIRAFDRLIDSIDRVGERLEAHEKRIGALEVMRRRGA